MNFMRICELKQEEVINIHTCRSLGCPVDVEFCCETARLKALVMPGQENSAGVFPEKVNVSSTGTASVRSEKISYLWISGMKKGSPENKELSAYFSLSRPFIFYISPEKVYFTCPLRIILMY